MLSPNNREFITKCPKVQIGSHMLRIIISGIKKKNKKIEEKISNIFFEKKLNRWISMNKIGNISRAFIISTI